MQFRYLNSDLKFEIVMDRERIIKRCNELGIKPRLDLGDIERVDTNTDFSVDVKLEYDSGNYLYLFGGMVNIDNFNVVVNSIDIGDNLVCFNLKEVLKSVIGNVSDKTLREALITFKLTLDLNKMSRVLNEPELNVSLFSYILKKSFIVDLDVTGLMDTLYKIEVLNQTFKDYVVTYKNIFSNLKYKGSGVVTYDRKLQLNILSTQSLEMRHELSVEEELKVSSNYRMHNIPFTYDFGVVSKAKSIQKDKVTKMDKIAITDNILEVAEVLDGNVTDLLEGNSVINKYVKDFNKVYRKNCIKEIKSGKLGLLNNKYLPNSMVQVDSLNYSKTNYSDTYNSVFSINSISAIIQDLKVLSKSKEIILVSR